MGTDNLEFVWCPFSISKGLNKRYRVVPVARYCCDLSCLVNKRVSCECYEPNRLKSQSGKLRAVVVASLARDSHSSSRILIHRPFIIKHVFTTHLVRSTASYRKNKSTGRVLTTVGATRKTIEKKATF